ncbi:IscS subfamily cysteine desulfurase [Candidatus Woesearchaeota archaeon]|nr:IscS subfamily cysteine desulfurase [Candidatus Woesearchaeota archaeon]
MTEKTIYLDNAAATPMRQEVKEAMDPFYVDVYGNPGSFNSVGHEALQQVDEARKTAARILNCAERELIFTGGGTESINLAIKGVAFAKKKGHIITTTVEHHAVLHTCEWLEKQGFEITYLPVDRCGLVTPEQVRDAIRPDTILVTVMYANNEIGTIMPIPEIVKVCKEKRVLFHTDACQAGCSQNLNVKELGVDMFTLNGSKIYGPKGVGLLYVRLGVQLEPLVHGGGQEGGKRGGTENVAGIVGFAKALELSQKEKEQENTRLIKLRDYLTAGLLQHIPKAVLNGHPTKRLPNNVNVSILDIEGEALTLLLNEHGICASTGSACTSGSLEPSHVILATGLPYEFAHGSIRFTMGRDTTKEDIDKVLEVMPAAVQRLRAISPYNLKLEEYISKEEQQAMMEQYTKVIVQ